jgi:energy-converting hydrogenase Eha subunit E
MHGQLNADLIAVGATLVIFLGAFLLVSTWLGLVFIAIGGVVMLVLIFEALRHRQ